MVVRLGKLIAAAGQLRQQIGAPLSPAERGKLEARLTDSGVNLLALAQAEADASAAAMSLDEAIDFAQAEVLSSPPEPTR